MTQLTLTPLHPKFAQIVHDVQLSNVRSDHLFPAIRQAFEEHSALLFRVQDFSDADHLALAQLSGPVENREEMAGHDVPFKISSVSNEDAAGGTYHAQDLRTLNLKANMLWHTDSTFLPIPALVNILTARVIPSTGGQTELASTRAGWAEMPADLRKQIKDREIWHRLSHSRARIDPKLAALTSMTRWPDRAWQALWRNPVTQEDALYIASHAFAVEGLDDSEGADLIDALIGFCTTPDRVYSHQWQIGDVLLWDERAVLHRGQPWPYEEPRSLSSICVSVTETDGLSSMLPSSAM
jgi:alpha-ketoglutarate-dependent 2,4-dichlorophenoxyacetate dioxygenase